MFITPCNKLQILQLLLVFLVSISRSNVNCSSFIRYNHRINNYESIDNQQLTTDNVVSMSSSCVISKFIPTSISRCSGHSTTKTTLFEMKRPILDQIASVLFRLENERVQSSSIIDEKGRLGEPMEWSESTSLANTFSNIIATNPIGYQFKQWVANVVAGEYNTTATRTLIETFIEENEIAMFSFTTCPFCRKAKDTLDELNLSYTTIELDLLDGNSGNAIRAELGKRTKRTSVPSIFINKQYIGGCNDGNPGLIPLLQDRNKFEEILGRKV